jgi:carbamoyltransferase
MIIAGVNLERTISGKELKNGGTCLIINGEIKSAVAEERISRKKYNGGFSASLEKSLSYFDISLKDIDKFIVSSCCESIRNKLPEFPNIKAVEFISHHKSHAYSAYFSSPFDKAIIIVSDGGGNVLNDSNEGENWWKFPREQFSIYIGKGDKLELVDREFDQPFDSGYGEVYRYFTHFLGWRSSDANKVMALSSLGNPNRFKGADIFSFNGKRIISNFINDPFSHEVLPSFFKKNGFGDISARNKNEEITQTHMDLARFVQDQITNSLISKVKKIIKKYAIKNFCLSGGVALNCLINEELLKNTPIDQLFVQPAANDQGQCLGNAIFGSVSFEHFQRQKEFNCFLGFEYKDFKESEFCLDETEKISIIKSPELYQYIAKQISENKIIGWFQGKSEFGPRALGNRSILADPRNIENKSKLNKIKQREWFNPFAPSIIDFLADDYFELSNSSPFMLRAITCKPQALVDLPATIHFDKTSRIQTVSKIQNEKFFNLIQEFYKITNVPALLNTSLNSHGKPIVESPKDAISVFRELNLDILVVNNFVIERRFS